MYYCILLLDMLFSLEYYIIEIPGRVLQIFQVCSSGGVSFNSIIRSPENFVKYIYSEPLCLVSISMTFFLMVESFLRKNAGTVQGIFVLVSMVITLIILASPGTDGNHLMDIIVASFIFITSSFAHQIYRHFKLFVCSYVIILIVIIPFNLPNLKSSLKTYIRNYSRYPKKLVELVENQPGKVLSEDPFIPILAHKSPYLLDAFMLRLIMLKDKSIKTQIINSIKRKKYSLLIFLSNPKKKLYYNGKDWYSEVQFGHDFIETVLKNYREYHKIRYYYVYLPNY